MLVFRECCELSGRGLCDGLITHPRSRTECRVPEYDHEALSREAMVRNRF